MYINEMYSKTKKNTLYATFQNTFHCKANPHAIKHIKAYKLIYYYYNRNINSYSYMP